MLWTRKHHCQSRVRIYQICAFVNKQNLFYHFIVFLLVTKQHRSILEKYLTTFKY
jgi:hypothetical protein